MAEERRKKGRIEKSQTLKGRKKAKEK